MGDASNSNNQNLSLFDLLVGIVNFLIVSSKKHSLTTSFFLYVPKIISIKTSKSEATITAILSFL